MGDNRTEYKFFFLWGKEKKRANLEDTDIDGNIFKK
jgi:hypothetical protein